ncbi:MAG: PilN domain-containing protein [Eubacteriales bacterium]|jgi:hypothetical protein
MYKVNLLPQAYIKNKRNQQIKNRVIYGLIILLIMVLSVYRLFSELAIRQSQQLDSLSQANANLTGTIQKLNDPHSPIADATKIDNIIDGMKDSEIDYVKFLILICNSAPDDILISDLSMAGSGDEQACVIQASAIRYESISEWISALGEIDGLDKISFSRLTTGDIDTQVDTEVEENEDFSKRIRFEFRISFT